VLRLTRLARLARVTKLVRWFHIIDALHVLLTSIQACGTVLVWSSLLIITVMSVCALTLNHALIPYFEAIPPAGSDEHKKFMEVFLYYGTFTRCMVSVFEICLGNHAPAVRVLMENVGEGFGPALLFFRLLVDFAIVKIITGVFLHETFSVANSDDALITAQKARSEEGHIKKFKKLFARADTDHDHYLSFQEFETIMSEPKVATWMSALGMDVSDIRLVFELLDDGDRRLSPEELVVGASRVKGPARSLDLTMLMYDVSHLKELITGMGKCVDKIMDRDTGKSK